MQNKDLDRHEYGLFSRFLEQHYGIVLGESKQYLVRSRLTPVAREHGYESLSDLVKAATNGASGKLRESVVDAMTTNETLWFRDNYPYQMLKSEILPKLASQSSPIKIWSAACSSGQEPYSIAMTALEYKQSNPTAFPGGIEILGTDLSSDMLKRAQEGEYDSLSVARGLTDAHKRSFFSVVPSQPGCYRINAEVKRLVRFKPINLLQSYSSLGKFDIVFCRNVLIYFSPEVKTRILQQIAACLQSDGVLFLGASESISGLDTNLIMRRKPQGLYYQRNS